MIVFDAGVLVAHLAPTDAFRESATAFMEEFEEFDFAANVVTLAECLVRPAAFGRSAEAIARLDQLMLIRLALPEDVAADLARVRAETRLRMPDAIVVYTAEQHGAELVTTDRTLYQAAEQRGLVAHLLHAA